jgi:hypothetical protein
LKEAVKLSDTVDSAKSPVVDATKVAVPVSDHIAFPKGVKEPDPLLKAGTVRVAGLGAPPRKAS